MNKKAWLRIVEAFIAVLIILGVILYIMSISSPKNDISPAVYEKEKYILDFVSKNEQLRERVLTTPLDDSSPVINNAIKEMISSSWDFETKVCSLDSVCGSVRAPGDREIYSSEIVVTSSNNRYELRKLRLFIWEK